MLKFEVWLDSGANAHSMRKDVAEIDMTQEEFDELSDDEKDELLREYAWSTLEWGWRSLEDGEWINIESSDVGPFSESMGALAGLHVEFS